MSYAFHIHIDTLHICTLAGMDYRRVISPRGFVVALVIALCLSPVAIANETSDSSLRKLFVELIAKANYKQCREISYFEMHERTKSHTVWDVRCIVGDEYLIYLPVHANERPEVIACSIAVTAGGPDCFHRIARNFFEVDYEHLFAVPSLRLIYGVWSSKGDTGTVPRQLDVSGSISWDDCKNVRFDLISDRAKMAVRRKNTEVKPNAAHTFRYDVHVREIAIHLKREGKCLTSKSALGEVLVFPITNIGFFEGNDVSCTSLIRVYRTRRDFQSSVNAMEFQASNDSCKMIHVPFRGSAIHLSPIT